MTFNTTIVTSVVDSSDSGQVMPYCHSLWSWNRDDKARACAIVTAFRLSRVLRPVQAAGPCDGAPYSTSATSAGAPPKAFCANAAAMN